MLTHQLIEPEPVDVQQVAEHQCLELERSHALDAVIANLRNPMFGHLLNYVT